MGLAERGALSICRQIVGEKFDTDRETSAQSAPMQNSALAKYTCSTVEVLSLELRLPSSPVLNTVDLKLWGCMQERVYKKPNMSWLS